MWWTTCGAGSLPDSGRTKPLHMWTSDPVDFLKSTGVCDVASFPLHVVVHMQQARISPPWSVLGAIPVVPTSPSPQCPANIADSASNLHTRAFRFS